MYHRPPDVVRFSITFIVEIVFSCTSTKKNYQYYASEAYTACSIVDMSRRILSILIKKLFFEFILFHSTEPFAYIQSNYWVLMTDNFTTNI